MNGDTAARRQLIPWKPKALATLRRFAPPVPREPHVRTYALSATLHEFQMREYQKANERRLRPTRHLLDLRA